MVLTQWPTSGVNLGHLWLGLQADKWIHAILFGLQGALTAGAGNAVFGRRFSVFGLALSVGFGLGLLTEGLQWLGGYRQADWADVVADVAGTFVGAVPVLFIRNRR